VIADEIDLFHFLKSGLTSTDRQNLGSTTLAEPRLNNKISTGRHTAANAEPRKVEEISTLFLDN
jgi:hypothetical protein